MATAAIGGQGSGSSDVGVRAAEARLQAAATFFAIAVVIHNADHWRRGASNLPMSVFVLGLLALVPEVGVVVLVRMRHPSAPLAAVAAGLGLAVGYLLVHFTPARSAASDSLIEGGTQVFTLFAAGLETVAALALAAAGALVLRAGGLARSAWSAERGSTVGVLTVLRQPVVAVMIIANVIILVGFIASR